MKLINKQIGQGLIECLLGLTVLVVVTVSVSEHLLPASTQQIDSLKLSRKVTWEKLRNLAKTKLSGRYSLNDDLELVFEPIDRLLSVNLNGNNLRMTDTSDVSIYRMARLTDSWEAKSKNDLASRPASLVVNNILSGPITEVIQDGLGRVFLAEELESDSLIFGHIDSDVVPENALIER